VRRWLRIVDGRQVEDSVDVGDLTLPHNSVWIGNASNVPIATATGATGRALLQAANQAAGRSAIDAEQAGAAAAVQSNLTTHIDLTGTAVHGLGTASTANATDFAPASHNHAWSHITSGVPATATRWPTWNEVTDKPTTFAPASHTLGSHSDTAGFSDTNPLMDGSVQQGSSTRLSRQDHRHPTDTSRAAASHSHAWSHITSGVPATATRWPTWEEVTSKPTTFAPSSHTLGSHSDTAGFSDTNPLMNGTVSQGASTRLSRQDHRHPTDTTLVPTARTITAGNGLTGGGSLAADRTVHMGTPGSITTSSANSASGTTHTHALVLPATISDIKAYVNADGQQSTPTIRGSINVSSLVRNGTGDYTLNFASSLQTGYCFLNGSGDTSDWGRVGCINPVTVTTSSFRFELRAHDGSLRNRNYVCVAIVQN